MKNYLFRSLVFSLDLSLLIFIFFLVSFLRAYIGSDYLPSFETIHLSQYSFAIFIILILFSYEGIYTYKYDFWQETHKVFKALIISFFIVLSLLTLTKTNYDYSRIFIISYFLTALVLVPFAKRYIKKILYFFDFFKTKVLVVGSKEQIEIFKHEFNKNWYLGQKYAIKNYESVIISTKNTSTEYTNELLTKYINQKVKLYIVPYITDINFSNSNIMEYANIRLNTIEVENKLLITRNILLKNISEKLLIIIIFPFFLLLHLLISLAISLDSTGKILFKQKRLGQNNKSFTCYKYRTMYTDSQKLLQTYLEKNPDEVLYYEKYHKYKKDPRITKIGNILRKTSLDELVQIINVLQGSMSLIGPRPYMLSESEKLGNHKELILKVKPGITGLWQVSGRNNLSFKERNELEVWYIKNWSLWSDFIILLKTIKTVLYRIGVK